MTHATRSRIASFMRAAAPVAPVLAAALLLFFFPPEQYSFYPQCPSYRYLHLLCPGCGATRALAALLHGNANEALRLNAFFTLTLPIALFYLAKTYLRFVNRQPLRWPQPPPLAIYTTLAVAILFTVTRNL